MNSPATVPSNAAAAHSAAEPALVVPAREWLTWAALLMFLYLLLYAYGWRRTLIGTETWALFSAGQPLAEQLSEIRKDLVHPPLMYMVERFWMNTFGHTDNAVRFLPPVFNLPTILLSILLATRITPLWRWLSFFMLTPYFHVGTSEILVRMYAPAMLWTVSAMLLWDMWREKPRTATLAAWVAAMTLLVYTHLFGFLLLAGFFVANWLLGPRRWAFSVASVIPGLAFIPWFFYVLPTYFARGLDANLTWVHKNLFRAWASVLYEFLGFIGPDTRGAILIGTMVAILIFTVLLVLALRERLQLWPPWRPPGLAALWFWTSVALTGVPVLGLSLFSVLFHPAFGARFLLGIKPALWIAVLLICQLSVRPGRRFMLAVLSLWAFAAIATPAVWYYHPNYQRLGAEFVAQRYLPGDLLLSENPDNANAIYWEWTRRLKLPPARFEAIDNHTLAVSLAIVKPVELESLDLNGVDRIWFFMQREDQRQRVTSFLVSRGFVPDEQRAAGAPLLLFFARRRGN